MLTTSLLLVLPLLVHCALASSPSYDDQLVRREAYADEVCSPNITSTDGTVPPCIEITAIEEACAPNGTSQIYYIAHAECMCGGSYFAEWVGCQDCLFFHGQRTERDQAYYDSVVSAASHSLCDFLATSASATATVAASAPTTDFAAIFSSVEATMTQPTTGATVSSDLAPSSTAVSLYFTLSGNQGPGAITGSAATATATTTKGSESESGSASSVASKSSQSSLSGTASGGGASSSSSTAGAQPTQAARGLLLGLAGLAVAAGL